MSADWDRQYKDGHGRYWPAEELVRFLGRHYGSVIEQNAAGLTAVEIGCGVGGNVRALAEWGFFTHGLELSGDAIQLGDAYAKRCGFESRKQYTQYRAPGTIKLPPNSINLVIDIQTIQHLNREDHVKIYREIHRILSPRGVFFSIHWAGFPYDRAGIFPEHKELDIWRSGRTLKKILKDAGFRIPYLEFVTKTYGGVNGRIGKWAIIEAVKI